MRNECNFKIHFHDRLLLLHSLGLIPRSKLLVSLLITVFCHLELRSGIQSNIELDSGSSPE